MKAVPGRKKRGGPRGKLTPEARQYVLSALAALTGPTKVQREVQERFRISVSPELIIWYRRKYDDEIQKLREAWLPELGRIPLRHKLVRLRELVKLYQGCVAEVRPKGERLDRMPEGLLQEVEAAPRYDSWKYDTMLNVLTQIRKEVGDDVQRVDLRGMFDPSLQAALDEIVRWIRKGDDRMVEALFDKALAQKRMLRAGAPVDEVAGPFAEADRAEE